MILQFQPMAAGWLLNSKLPRFQQSASPLLGIIEEERNVKLINKVIEGATTFSYLYVREGYKLCSFHPKIQFLFSLLFLPLFGFCCSSSSLNSKELPTTVLHSYFHIDHMWKCFQRPPFFLATNWDQSLFYCCNKLAIEVPLSQQLQKWVLTCQMVEPPSLLSLSFSVAFCIWLISKLHNK